MNEVVHVGTNISSYREAEQRLWMSKVGALPSERYVRLPQLGTHVRLFEHGQGPTLLFIHGGPSAASKWAPLVKFLPDFRCVLLDRPGCGLSEQGATSRGSVRQDVVQLVADTLDVVEAEPTAIVASSFGSFCAFAFAIAHPDKLPRMVHMGCPALVPGATIPLPFLLPVLPVLGSLIRRLEPPTLTTSQQAFERMGHSSALVQSPTTAEFFAWYTALTRDTPTRTNDQTLFGRVRPSDRLRQAELEQITTPTSFFWGENDTFGGPPVARNLVAHMPHATLELVAHSGHLPWLDAPEQAANHIRSFLEGRKCTSYIEEARYAS